MENPAKSSVQGDGFVAANHAVLRSLLLTGQENNDHDESLGYKIALGVVQHKDRHLCPGLGLVPF